MSAMILPGTLLEAPLLLCRLWVTYSLSGRLRLLSVLLPVLTLALLLLRVLLLGMLLSWFGLLVLALFFSLTVLLVVVPLLCIPGRKHTENDRQNSDAGDSDLFHLYACVLPVGRLALLQTPCGCIRWTANSFTGHEKFHSAV